MNKNIFKFSLLLLLNLFLVKGAHAGTTPITNLGVNNAGGFPVVLSTAGETYQLWEDINCDTTCFTVKASNITVDLNGKTATFGTANNPGMLNTEFEDWNDSSSLNNWTMINGTVTKKTAIIYGNYDAELSPTAVIKSDNVVIKAGQTYIYYSSIKGNYNDSYVISVRSVADDSILASATIGGILGNGFAMISGSLEGSSNFYKPTVDTAVYLQIECSGANVKTLHLADIKPSRHYFLAAHNYRNTAFFPDLPDNFFGFIPSNVLIKNGTILQGAGEAVKAVAVRSDGTNLENMTIRMSGNNSAGAALGSDFTVDSTTFDTASIYNFNRMAAPALLQFDQASVGRIEIKNSTFLNSPEMSISCYSGHRQVTDTHTISIHDNIFRGKEWVVEGYAIGLSGVVNVTIENNDINPIRGRGILLDAVANNPGYIDGTSNVIIRNNIIRNIYEINLPEFSVLSLEATGIRIREFFGESNPQEGHRNLNIYGNTISVYANSAGTHRSYGMYITANVSVDSINIHDNTINADLISSATSDWAVTCFAMSDTDERSGGTVNIYNNVCNSNSRGIHFGDNDGTGTSGVNIYKNIITAKYPFFFYGYPGSPAKPFSYLNIYENIIQNNDVLGYPFYLESIGYSPVVDNVYISNNNISNINAGGYELYTTKNYSAGLNSCDNGIFDITGGGSIGSVAAPCHDGIAGGWSEAGLSVNDSVVPSPPSGLSML